MAKQKLLLALIAAGFAQTAYAAPSSYSSIGPNIGYGDNSNPNSIYAPLANPANNALNAADTEGYRFGLGGNAQIDVTISGLEGSKDYWDNNISPYLGDITKLTTVQNNLTHLFNSYNQGKVSTISGGTIPLLIKSKSLSGGLSLDYTRQIGTKGTLIDGPNNVVASANGSKVTINSNTAAFALAYTQLDEFALGYGTTVYKTKTGSLSVGMTGRMLTIMRNQNNLDFKQIVDDNASGSKNFGDYINNLNSGSSDTNYTADIGINWNAANYKVGLTGYNLTEPSFKINNQTSTNPSYNSFSHLIKSKFKLKSQYRLSAETHTQDRHWTLAGSYDLTKSNNLNNDDVQWWDVSGSYATNSAWYIPDVRLGLRGNLVGTKYTYANAGLTFGFLTLDLSTTTLDFNAVANKQKNAGVMASAGVSFDF